MGGFTSAPPVLAARSLGAKTFLHESNTIPGRANRWLARFVDQAFVGFPQATERLRVREATVTGTPVRSSFRVDSPASNSARPMVLVMGGSQGASGVNDLILAALPLLAERVPHWRWVHLTGPNDCEKVKAGYAQHKLQAEVHPFLTDMSFAMTNATAAVSRAGASSLAEIAAVRLPSLLIPFPAAADDHQRFNARVFEETGAARAIDQKLATPEKFFALLQPLVEAVETRNQMQLALAKWDAPQAAERIAASILDAVVERVGDRVSRAMETPGSDHKKSRALSFGIWSLAFGVLNLLIA
jgi:UDP-N-acetylglucosamine--N-acetylmuramyl-(pentapeptide) pyrophosphoryl-undecaprenol N-acetylglucosamine transferase